MASPQCVFSDDIQDVFMSKTFITLFTFKWFIPSVCSLISYINDYFELTFFPLITIKWSLPTVYSLMTYSNSSISKTFYTHSHVNVSAQCMYSDNLQDGYIMGNFYHIDHI